MNIEITGRHVEITPALREYAEEKLRKLERLLDGPLEAHVVLGIEKHRHMAEIQIKSRGGTLSGTVETSDLYASIAEVVDKLERQALKHKEKVHDHKHRKGPRDPAVAATIEANAAPEDTVPRTDGAVAGRRIVRIANYRLKPLSAEDAALELEASGLHLLVFRDTDSNRLNVIYRQPNGDYGLVEPEF